MVKSKKRPKKCCICKNDIPDRDNPKITVMKPVKKDICLDCIKKIKIKDDK